MKRTESKSKPSGEAPVVPGTGMAPAPIAWQTPKTLGELTAAMTKGIEAKIVIGGKGLAVSGRRLTPAELRLVSDILNEALPPEIPAEYDEEASPPREIRPVRYDFNNADYRRAKEDNKRLARAVALWMAYPIFAEGYPNGAAGHDAADALRPAPPDPGTAALQPKSGGMNVRQPGNRQEIVKFIENLPIEEDALDLLFMYIREQILDVQAVADFFSKPGSRKS